MHYVHIDTKSLQVSRSDFVGVIHPCTCSKEMRFWQEYVQGIRDRAAEAEVLRGSCKPVLTYSCKPVLTYTRETKYMAS